MWMEHDADAIRAIQDALGCCGFRSVKDMAWPFPRGKSGEEAGTCAKKFEREVACREPWQKAMAAAAGGDFGVLVGALVLQGLPWLLVKLLGRDGFRGVLKVLGRLFGRSDHEEPQEERVRPLLGDVEDAEEGRVGYGGTVNTVYV